MILIRSKMQKFLLCPDWCLVTRGLRKEILSVRAQFERSLYDGDF